MPCLPLAHDNSRPMAPKLPPRSPLKPERPPERVLQETGETEEEITTVVDQQHELNELQLAWLTATMLARQGFNERLAKFLRDNNSLFPDASRVADLLDHPPRKRIGPRPKGLDVWQHAERGHMKPLGDRLRRLAG